MKTAVGPWCYLCALVAVTVATPSALVSSVLLFFGLPLNIIAAALVTRWLCNRRPPTAEDFDNLISNLDLKIKETFYIEESKLLAERLNISLKRVYAVNYNDDSELGVILGQLTERYDLQAFSLKRKAQALLGPTCNLRCLWKLASVIRDKPGLLSLTVHGEKLVGPGVFGDVGAALAAHPVLVRLELYGNSIDGPTAESLVTTVAGNRNIRRLNLGNNNIMAEARDRITEATEGTSLRVTF
jgi:hypothetical protein